MTSVYLTQALRPLKLAYIVSPNDMTSLSKVIETNSFLWGAKYNPILPLYKRTPQYLKNNFRINKISDLLYGNLKFFEPDYIVITGDIRSEEIENPPCQVIKLQDIYENIAEEGMPGYGLGLCEIVEEYYDKEFKFLRRDNLSHYFPTFKKGNNSFLKSVFGCFPKELPNSALEYITESLEAKEERITIDNYLSFLNPAGPLNIHRLINYALRIDLTKPIARQRHVIFLLDLFSYVDVIDYINLKAAGYSVLPISRSLLQTDQAKNLCKDFIEDKSWVHRDNPHATHSVTMQRSRTITEEELKAFYAFVNPQSFNGQDRPKCIKRLDFPGFWSRWDQEKGHVSCASITAGEREISTITDERQIRSLAIAPSFISDRTPKPFKPRFANDIHISTFASNQDSFMAGIYPSNSDEVARAAGLLGINEWLIKDSSLTKLCRTENDSIFFDVQYAQEIFLSWLKSKGWEAQISDAGKVAYQMLKHLGGPWGITFLQGKKLIEFIVGKNDEEGSEGRPQPSSGIASQDFTRKAKEAYTDHFVLWGEERFVKSFFRYNIFQLGVELQCDICARRSWHPIDSLNYSIKCPHCLNTFEIPSHNPSSIKWSYKTIGPFSAAGKGAGAYSVLLTANFFDRGTEINNSTTTVLSFKATKNGLEIEADLGLFYREYSFFNRGTELIFCECKTYRRFTRRDINRMRDIAKEFPGAIIVFSTLNDDFTSTEKKIIKPFVNTCNKYHERDRPINPVMLLTANELFSFLRPPSCWQDKGGKYEPFAGAIHYHGLLDICQATQNIYLELEPWWESWEKEWRKRRKQI